MKTKDEVEARLKKLADRSKAKYVKKSQLREHRNCSYNQLHTPTEKHEATKAWETNLAPRRQVTLIVMEPERPIGICMYGADKPETWQGSTCDDDEIAHACPLFTPKTSREEAEIEFDDIMKDDVTTMNTYPEIAALQWVLGTRVWRDYQISEETSREPMEEFSPENSLENKPEDYDSKTHYRCSTGTIRPRPSDGVIYHEKPSWLDILMWRLSYIFSAPFRVFKKP